MNFPTDMNSWIAVIALGLLLTVGLVVAAWIVIGLFQSRSLFRRELSAYLLSPIAYVVLVVFLAMTGFLFYQTLDLLTASGAKGVEYPMQKLLGDEKFWLVFLFIPPLLTMRLFAEERSTGTLEMLMTAPMRDWQVVLSKYFACFAFYVVLWLPTLAYLPVLMNLHFDADKSGWVMTNYTTMMAAGAAAMLVAILMAFPRLGTTARLVELLLFIAGAAAFGIGIQGHFFGEPDSVEKRLVAATAGIDPWPVLTSYIGLALAGAMFLAIGLLVSSLVRSQMVAALISLVLCLFFIGGGFWLPDLDSGSALGRFMGFFSIPRHFSRDFTRGVLDTRHMILYGSVTVFSLFLTVRSLESRRWR